MWRLASRIRQTSRWSFCSPLSKAERSVDGESEELSEDVGGFEAPSILTGITADVIAGVEILPEADRPEGCDGCETGGFHFHDETSFLASPRAHPTMLVQPVAITLSIETAARGAP